MSNLTATMTILFSGIITKTLEFAILFFVIKYAVLNALTQYNKNKKL